MFARAEPCPDVEVHSQQVSRYYEAGMELAKEQGALEAGVAGAVEAGIPFFPFPVPGGPTAQMESLASLPGSEAALDGSRVAASRFIGSRLRHGGHGVTTTSAYE